MNEQSFNSENQIESLPQEVREKMVDLAEKKFGHIEPATNEKYPDGFVKYDLGPDKKFFLFYFNIVDKKSANFGSTKAIKYNLETQEISSAD